jgi:hypothetical protein
MTKKNWGLMIVLLVLGGTFAVLTTRTGMSTSLQVDEDLFAVADTAAIQRIELQQAGGQQVQLLDRNARGWRLNQEHPADPRLMRLLLSVLHNVEVKRPVARNQQAPIRQNILQQGTRVRVYDGAGLQQDFYAGGIEERQLSYFMKDELAYVMELPGYINYISGIFQLNEHNLRDKTLFRANHFNLQAVRVEYPGQEEENVQINFDGERLEVEGVVRPDSIMLLEFLDLFNGLQAVGYVDTQEFPELDSLLQQQPQAIISVSTVQQPEGKHLEVYPGILENRYRLSRLPTEEQAVLLDEQLAQQLLLQRSQLEKSKDERQ